MLMFDIFADFRKAMRERELGGSRDLASVPDACARACARACICVVRVVVSVLCGSVQREVSENEKGTVERMCVRWKRKNECAERFLLINRAHIASVMGP